MFSARAQPTTRGARRERRWYHPREVEEALAEHPDVVEAAVFGLPDAAALAAFCRERLASCKKPRSIRFVASLPRNAMGKVLKDRLAR